MKRWLSGRTGTVIKICVSAVLIALILRGFEWDQLGAQLEKVNPWLLAVAFALYIAQFGISAWKWRICLEIHDLRHSLPYLTKVICIGFFFNNFLPSCIGGDGYRVVKTMPEDGLKSRSLSAVLLERITGLGALVVIGIVGGYFLLFDRPAPLVTWFVIGASAGLCVLGAGALALRAGWLRSVRNLLGRVEKLRIVGQNVGYIRRERARLVEVLAISLFFQLIAVVVIWVLFRVVGEPAAFSKCAVIGAISALVAVMPISINGIGVWEGSIVVAAVQTGIDANPAIVVAFLTRFSVVVLSLACGAVWLVDGGRRVTAEDIAESEKASCCAADPAVKSESTASVPAAAEHD